MASAWIKIGIVGRPHGLGGAFFVSRRDEIVPRAYKKIRIGDDPEKAEEFEWRASRMQAGRPLLHLKSHTRRECIEPYVGQSLWVARHLVEVDGDREFLWDDLIGVPVIDCHGNELGTVAEVTNYGASDIVTIRAQDNRSLDIPVIHNYVLIEKIAVGQPIQLKVSRAVFESLWTPPRG